MLLASFSPTSFLKLLTQRMAKVMCQRLSLDHKTKHSWYINKNSNFDIQFMLNYFSIFISSKDCGDSARTPLSLRRLNTQSQIHRSDSSTLPWDVKKTFSKPLLLPPSFFPIQCVHYKILATFTSDGENVPTTGINTNFCFLGIINLMDSFHEIASTSGRKHSVG